MPNNPTSRVKTDNRYWSLETRSKTRSGPATAGVCGPMGATQRYGVRIGGVNTVTYGPDFRDWRERLLRGSSATTSLVGTRYTMKYTEADMTSVIKKSSPFYVSNACHLIVAEGSNLNQTFPTVPIAAMNADAEQIAARNFLKSYIRETRSWHGGATIAEFAETVRFMGSPLKSLYKRTWTFIGKVKKLRKVYERDKILYAKLLAQLWLAYAFAIAPMVSDVNAAQDAVRSLCENLNSVDVKRIVGSGQVNVQESWSTNTSAPGFFGRVEQDVFTHLVNGVKYLGAIKVRPPGFSAIAQDFGVGFTDIVPAVWEGIPWSWLFDYFLNVQEVLESYKLAWAEFAWLQRTVRNRRVRFATPFRPSVLADYETVCNGGKWYTQVTRVTRGAVAGPPYPNFQFKIPGALGQIGNLSALFLAIKGSKPGRPSPGIPDYGERRY